MQIRIEKLVYGGTGMARTDEGVVFVPRTIPGELIEAKIVERRKDYAYGELIDVIEKSKYRRKPSCPNFETVGCCDWNHIAYEQQLHFKQEIIVESLVRLGKIEWPQDISVLYGQEDKYRLRASFHVINQRLGFMRKGTNDVVPISRCVALMPTLNNFLKEANEALVNPEFDGTEVVQAIVSPKTGDIAATFCRGKERAIWADQTLTTTVCGIEFELVPNLFFQPNQFLLEQVMSSVVNLSNPVNLTMDLFCGSGFFSLPLAKLSSRVVGVDRRSTRIAIKNAQRNQVTNIEFIKASVSQFLAHSNLRPDLVILDPPRSGAGHNIVRKIAALSPEKIVYISCNPTTFAPEASLFIEGGYTLSSLKFIDQFPHSHHIETIGLFQK